MKSILSIIKSKLRELFHIQSPSLYISRYNKMAGKWMEQGMKSIDDIWLISEEETGFDFDTANLPLSNEGEYIYFCDTKYPKTDKSKFVECERPNRITIDKYELNKIAIKK